MPVSFNYIPGDIRVPLFYAEVDPSAASVTVGTNQSVLIGQMLSGGTAEAGVPVRVATAAKAKALFGRGSQLARMVEAFRANNPSGVLFCVPLAEPDGSQAAGAITFSGEATEAGVVYAYIGSTRVSAAVAAGDTANSVAMALAASINAKADLPVTAEVLVGTTDVTLTAKNIGLAGNDIKVSINYNGSAAGEELPDGIGAEVTAMAGGTGTPDVTTAFDALGDEAFEFIGIPYCDTVTLDACAAEMQDASGRWSPTRQLYGHVYTALRGESGTLAGFGSARNDQHCSIFGYEPNALDDVCAYVGAILGRTSVFITNDPARPTQTGLLVGLAAPRMQDRFTLAERQEMLTSGIATVYTSGNVRIERAVTTCQRNAFGDEDVSYLDSETLHTLSYILRYLRSIITTKYPRHKLANDGTRFGAGQAVVTPSIIRAELISAYRYLEDRAIVENADAFAENLIVERDSADVNRLNVLFPPDLVNQLRIFAVLAQFRLQYTATED
jgi:phage tail sheath gpL-like